MGAHACEGQVSAHMDSTHVEVRGHLRCGSSVPFTFWDRVSHWPATSPSRSGNLDHKLSAICRSPCPIVPPLLLQHVPPQGLGYCFFFNMGSGDLNSTPHDYEVRTSPTEPCPQTKINDYVCCCYLSVATLFAMMASIKSLLHLHIKTSWLHLCVSVFLLCSIDPCLCPC